MEELLLSLGILSGVLTWPERAAEFVALLASDEERKMGVWVRTRYVRDRLTELLREAGREL